MSALDDHWDERLPDVAVLRKIAEEIKRTTPLRDWVANKEPRQRYDALMRSIGALKDAAGLRAATRNFLGLLTSADQGRLAITFPELGEAQSNLYDLAEEP